MPGSLSFFSKGHCPQEAIDDSVLQVPEETGEKLVSHVFICACSEEARVAS